MSGLLARYTAWENRQVHKFDMVDIRLIKMSAAAATLMIAKLWKPLLSLGWYVYGVLSLIFAIRPTLRMVAQKEQIGEEEKEE